MTDKEKKSMIKIIILVIVQSVIIWEIMGCAEIEGFPLSMCWGIKAGGIFLLIVASVLLIKEIIKLSS